MKDASPRCFILCFLLALSLAGCDFASFSGPERAEPAAEYHTASRAFAFPPAAGKAQAISTKMSNTLLCEDLIDLGPLTKLVTVWYQDEVRLPPHGVVGCVEVLNVSLYQIKFKRLPENYALRVTPVGPVTGTVTIDDNLITWTSPPDYENTDHWRVEVIDNSNAAPVVKHILEMKLENA